MNILSDFSESLITEEKRQSDKQSEKFDITSVEINPANKLDGVISNTGQIPLKIKTLWIEETGTPDSVTKFDIGEIIAPGNQINLLDVVDFDMNSTKGYTMKMISDRGASQTFYINSVGSNSLYLSTRTIPPTISNAFDATILLTVVNNSTSSSPILNLTPISYPTVDDSACTPDCTATYVSGPNPPSYPRLGPGETASFSWIYKIDGVNANQIQFTTSLLNGVSTNNSTATVEVRDILSALESGTAINSLGLQSNGVDSSILILHEETDRTPSARYQMFSASSEGGIDGQKIDLDSTPAMFFTQNGSSTITIPDGNWISSLRLQSEALPGSLKNEGEDMIFHFNVNTAVQDNSEGTASADIEACNSIIMPVETTSSSDDAEERVSNGNVDAGNSDLEMAYDGGNLSIVGLRFTTIPIPQGAIIESAYIQFTSDENQSGNTVRLTIRGEASDDAAPINESNSFDISGRANTAANVSWNSLASWNTGDSGANQLTPDIKTIIQEIVNRGGWTSGNDLLIKIQDNLSTPSTSSTRRTAEPNEGGAPPQLLVTYRLGTVVTDPPSYNATGGPHSSGTYRFDGVKECFRSINDVSSGDGNHLFTAPHTTALWFKTAATVGSTDQHLVSWEGSGTCPACDYAKVYLEANTGKVTFQFNMNNGGSDTSTCKSTGRFDDQQWYHVVAVRKSTNDNCGLFITDLAGTTVETINTSYNWGSSQVDTDGKWYIGSNPTESGNFFNGWIDDVIHWNSKELSSTPEASDLSRTNYGTEAHKLNISVDKADVTSGINLSTIFSAVDIPIPFYDPQGTSDNTDSTYGTFNYTVPLNIVTIEPTERMNYTISYVPSTSTWTALELDFKIDDETITPTTSLLQIPPPDTPFPSYWIYDKSNRLEVSIYNVGPQGSWFVYQGTRAVFLNPFGSPSYSGLICSVNSTQSDPCSTGSGNDNWRVDEHRDSIFIPVGSVGKIYFWDVQDRPDRDLNGGTEIPAGEYDMFVFIDGYDEKGAKFLRNLEMGRVKVQD